MVVALLGIELMFSPSNQPNPKISIKVNIKSFMLAKMIPAALHTHSLPIVFHIM